MVKVLRFILITTLLLPTADIFAQNNHFSKNGIEAYVAGIEEVFSVSTDRRAARDFVNEVRLFWNNPDTRDDFKETVMKVSDRIHEKRGRPYPDYHLYLSTILNFTASGHPQSSFDVWHNGLLELLSNPRYQLRHANRLMELTTDMLNEQVVYSTAALKWYASQNRFTFSFTDSLYVNINETNLVCKARNDSIVVLNTSGRVNLMSGLWQGTHGAINWEQSGFTPDMVYATFKDYSLDMSRNEIRVENVDFYNRHYFSEPLRGHIHHRMMSIRNPENTTYPKFESYEQRYRIDNIHNGFHYEGGFSQHGSKFLGSGTSQSPAVITIFRNDELFLTAKSLYFALRKDQIISNTCEITIHLDTGFIYHPGLLFKYLDPVKEIHLIRDGEGLSQSPFFNTYHNISMDTELIKWKITEPIMELRMITGASENHAFFESISYFREEFYNRLQGMDALHPLQGLLNCSRRFGERPFTAADYARFLGMPESQVRQQVIGLSFHGFVGYNVNTDYIEIRERLTDFLMFRAGRKDYDVIRFKSTTPGSVPNAIFDLRNYDLSMEGVSAISISDRQNVVFFPQEEKIILKRDRNFSFDGAITAGLINLYGNSFLFNYQDFRIDLTAIDSMAMRVETERLDYYGRRAQRRIRSTVAQLSGFLEIDRNDNKSGKENYAEYPRLTSNTNSFVYYDHSTTQNGAYERESFYFILDPFRMDSINSLSRNNIAFSGKFNSGIFPVIDETLVVRPDFSLGFRRTSPERGYPVYGGKADFTNIIDLSNEGLLGNGTLTYLASSSSSEEFTFLPDVTKGLAHAFNITPSETGVEYPDVQGKYARIEFQPFRYKLLAHVMEEPFTLYNRETTLDGTLTVSPNGLEGSGQFNMAKAYLVAKRFDLGHHVVMADSSDFNLISETSTSEVNFRTTNLISNINFKTRQGSFTSRDAGNKVEFTENRYLAYINEFSWDMDKNDIYLGARGAAGNRFVSTHRRQDSLDFIVPLALYDVEARKIYAEEVKSIKVADTEMFLQNGKVTINRDAVLDLLDSVKIVLNDSLHHFYDARVNIEGKYAYNAQGKYDFVNGNNDKKVIGFSKIDVGRDRRTRAEGVIAERELFTFNRYFAFKGDVALSAGKPLLTFKGGAQMLHNCSLSGPQNYVRFESEIDPAEVRIPIAENTQNFEFENIYRHFYLNRDSNVIYSAFLESRRFHSDVPLLSASGLLHFNENLNSFIIAQPHKINQPDTIGNVIRYHNEGCLVTGEGKINMGLELEQVKTFASGQMTHTRNSERVDLLTLFGTDFMLDNRSVEIMTLGLRNADSERKGNPESPGTVRRMGEWMDMENAVKVSRELQGFERMRSLPAEHQHMLVLDSLSWTWDPASRSYLANTEAVMLWIKDNPVNRKVQVKASIAFSRGGNALDIHIKASDEVYFFFSYRNGMMQTRSSLEEYNTNVQTLKPDDRKLKTRLGERPYSFIMAPESRVRRLLRLFEDGVRESDDEDIEETSETQASDE
ncbi:hypothetical protein [Alkaliflexus imshenetskii]|uniref:hypothetical protein n=1 Tax=Alkaliflexus imshenetskii TaxID=286730 RepID=UPI0004AE34B7|nr:hypothetical protein [Alkaliflexus imshenetskii]